MALMHVAARLTTEEFLALEEPPMLRFELIDGELVTMNSPVARHQHAVLRIASALDGWCRAEHGRGIAILDISTEAGLDTVLRPDVEWFSEDRMPTSTGLPVVVGDLIVEVSSPSTARYDARTKVPRYFAHGAREVWLVDPEAFAVDVRYGADGVQTQTLGRGDALTSSLLPGFSLPLAALAWPGDEA